MVSEIWASPLAQQVKNPPAMQETVCKVGNKSSIPGLGRPLEKEMTAHSSILAWEIPWTEEPGELRSRRLQESDAT